MSGSGSRVYWATGLFAGAIGSALGSFLMGGRPPLWASVLVGLLTAVVTILLSMISVRSRKGSLAIDTKATEPAEQKAELANQAIEPSHSAPAASEAPSPGPMLPPALESASKSIGTSVEEAAIVARTTLKWQAAEKPESQAWWEKSAPRFDERPEDVEQTQEGPGSIEHFSDETAERFAKQKDLVNLNDYVVSLARRPPYVARSPQCPSCGAFGALEQKGKVTRQFACKKCRREWEWRIGFPWPAVRIDPRIRQLTSDSPMERSS